MNVIPCVQRVSSRQRSWNPLIRCSESHKTFIYGIFHYKHICAQRTEPWLLFYITASSLGHLKNFSWNHEITTGQKPWLCRCIPCTVRDTLGSSGVEFGLSGMRYEKKHCPFTMTKHGSFSVLQRGHLFGLSWKPLVTKGNISSTTLHHGTSLWFRKLLIKFRLNFGTEFGRHLSSSLISIKNCLDPSCIYSLPWYSASHNSIYVFRLHANPSIMAYSQHLGYDNPVPGQTAEYLTWQLCPKCWSPILAVESMRISFVLILYFC